MDPTGVNAKGLRSESSLLAYPGVKMAVLGCALLGTLLVLVGLGAEQAAGQGEVHILTCPIMAAPEDKQLTGFAVGGCVCWVGGWIGLYCWW